jgi:lipopolysaccharide biosynthesis glycosyltransferase
MKSSLRKLRHSILDAMAYLTWRLDLIRSHWYEGFSRHMDPVGDRMVFVTVLNDRFVPYMAVLLHSIQRYHPDLDVPWKLFWNRRYSPLSDINFRKLQSIYKHLEMVEVDARNYRSFIDKTPDRLLAALFTLETFAVRGYNRVWFLDADMVCLGDLSRLWQESRPMVACRSGNDYREKCRMQNMYTWDGGFNTGVFMVGTPYLRDDVYEDLFKVECASYNVADQDVMNTYFRGKPVYLLPQKYNYHAGFFWDLHGEHDDVRLLHYAGRKPLDEPDTPRMKPWWDSANLLISQYPEWAKCISQQ